MPPHWPPLPTSPEPSPPPPPAPLLPNAAPPVLPNTRITRAVAVVTFSTVLGGTVSDFDAAGFKVRLAVPLEGVEADDISVIVAAASVRVTASIGAASVDVANITMAALSSLTTETLSAALGGVSVESLDGPTITWSDGGPHAQGDGDASLSGATDNLALGSAGVMPTTQVALFVVLTVFVLTVIVLIALCCCSSSCRSKRSLRNGVERISSKTFETFESMEMAAKPTSHSHLDHVSTTGGRGALERARTANRSARVIEDEDPQMRL